MPGLRQREAEGALEAVDTVGGDAVRRHEWERRVVLRPREAAYLRHPRIAETYRCLNCGQSESGVESSVCPGPQVDDEGESVIEYEETGETTEDIAEAVGWGVWRDADGDDFCVQQGKARLGMIVRWRRAQDAGGWEEGSFLGLAPYTGLRERVKSRSGAELRRWMVENPGARVKPVDGAHYQMWWNGELSRFCWTPGRDDDRVGYPPEEPCVPDGRGW